VKNQSSAEISLRKDLCRLARFGANISDAYSCFIFLPTWVLSLKKSQKGESDLLKIGGYHSLSNDVVTRCRLAVDSGLIGWAARHNRSIHVSPFDRDSRTLGIYSSDQHLKSFIGIPVPVKSGNEASDYEEKSRITGVVACDSKKSFAFSKIQGKLLEDLAREIANTVRLWLRCCRQSVEESSFESFMKKGQMLVDALGNQSVEILRLQPVNLSEIESALGTAGAISAYQQILRLIQQALPPHFPLCKLPGGEIIVVLDSMMAGFYENRIRAISGHINTGGMNLRFEYTRKSFRDKKSRMLGLEGLISATHGSSSAEPFQKGIDYEYCRA